MASRMAPPVRTPPAAWIDAGLRALAGGGPDAVKVDVLARSLGVTRGSFYAHFPSRTAFLDALLDAWERAATDEVLEAVERRGGDARTKLRRAGAMTFSDELLPVELAVRSSTRRDKAVLERLRRVDDRRLGLLRELFGELCDSEEEVEARAVLAFSLAIGHHLMAAGHPGRTRAEALDLAAAELLR